MKRRELQAALMTCLAIIIPCQLISQVIGAKNTAAGGISSLAEDLWAAGCNPAGLAGVAKRGIGLDYEQRFLLRELASIGAVATWPAGNGALGFHMGQAGTKFFRELDLGLSYGMAFGKYLHAGISLEYRGTMSPEYYGNYHALTFRIGLITTLNPKFRISFDAYNPWRVFYSSAPNAICPTVFRIGTSYQPAGSVRLLTELEKEPGYRITWRIGINMSFGERFIACAGYITYPSAVTFGCGFALRRIEIFISSVMHQYLGYYPHLSLQYQF